MQSNGNRHPQRSAWKAFLCNVFDTESERMTADLRPGTSLRTGASTMRDVRNFSTLAMKLLVVSLLLSLRFRRVGHIQPGAGGGGGGGGGRSSEACSLDEFSIGEPWVFAGWGVHISVSGSATDRVYTISLMLGFRGLQFPFVVYNHGHSSLPQVVFQSCHRCFTLVRQSMLSSAAWTEPHDLQVSKGRLPRAQAGLRAQGAQFSVALGL